MIQISMVPQEFVEKYNLKEKAHNGYIFAWVTKGMYGTQQAGRTGYDALVQHLQLYGYRPSSKTKGLQTHGSLPINLTLVLNFFGVKYSEKEHDLHLK